MKIIALYDTHIGFDYKGNANHINLNPIFRFIRDFKPDQIILGGDMHDWTPASHWIANQSIQLDGQNIQRCFKELHQYLLSPLKCVMPKHTKIKYLIGNHEDWLEQTMLLNRNGLGYWRLEDNIDLKKYNMNLFPFNYAYSPNKYFCYIHGVFTIQHHAKKTVETYRKSVFYGHVHDIQTYTAVSPIDVGDFYKGASVGCLCKLNPSYAHNKPNRWVNGFHFCHVDDKTGYFHDTQIVIVKGGFWANEKFYK